MCTLTRLLLAITLLSHASAQQLTPSVQMQVIPRGVRLDAGSGPKDFTCQAGRVTHALQVGRRTVQTSGQFLTLAWDEDGHLRLEAHDQVRPLGVVEVQLSCQGENMRARFGSGVSVQESP